ncbi:MAG: LysR family transcriptional regulator [Panacagrimonas sp.]
MTLRLLRNFVTVAKELNFRRAARRLHIEQSPLSRGIRKLETELGVSLVERSPRGSRLTWAGEVFLEDAQRLLLTFEQAQARARAAAAGYRHTLRIALSDDIGPARLSALLAMSRNEEPETGIRLFTTTFEQLMAGLQVGLYDVGFSLGDHVESGLVAEPAWQDALVVAIPARHPLLAYRRVPIEEVVNYPLVLCHPEIREGCSRQFERALRLADARMTVAEYVTTHHLMLTLVAAGYGVGFSSEAYVADWRHESVVVRPLIDRSATLTTYLLRREQHNPSIVMGAFTDRVSRVGAQSLTMRGHAT